MACMLILVSSDKQNKGLWGSNRSLDAPYTNKLNRQLFLSAKGTCQILIQSNELSSKSTRSLPGCYTKPRADLDISFIHSSIFSSGLLQDLAIHNKKLFFYKQTMSRKTYCKIFCKRSFKHSSLLKICNYLISSGPYKISSNIPKML